MPLPRFSAGSIGPADFRDWNRVMAATEAVEARPRVAKRQAPGPTPPIVARLGNAVTGAGAPTWDAGYKVFEWRQVEAYILEPSEPWKFRDLPNGNSHAKFAPGGFAFTTGGLTTGDYCELRRVPVAHGDTGSLGRVWFAAEPFGAMGATASGRIVAETNSGGVLGLNGYTVALFDALGGWFNPGAVSVFAVNLFEQAGAVQQQIDTQSPGTKTILKLPFNTVVGPMHLLPFVHSPPVWAFTFPNAYTVVC